jgi:hypothetical protein
VLGPAEIGGDLLLEALRHFLEAGSPVFNEPFLPVGRHQSTAIFRADAVVIHSALLIAAIGPSLHHLLDALLMCVFSSRL